MARSSATPCWLHTDAFTGADEGHETEAEPHQETDDEGIERDADDYQQGAAGVRNSGPGLARVLEVCTSRVQGAEMHYRAVCRALVAEALELSTFLERVSTGAGEMRLLDRDACRDLDQLNFQDWVSSGLFFCGCLCFVSLDFCVCAAVKPQDLAGSASTCF